MQRAAKSNIKWFVVSDDAVGQRLDVFCANNMPNLNRSMIQKLIESGSVEANNSQQKASYTLKLNDVVGVDFDDALHNKVPVIDLPVLYEDDDCIVISKPVGVLTHSKGAFNPEGTVATFIAPKVKGMDGDRAGIVHRLDRATSGVIICAKTPEALKWLQKQFSARKTKKIYTAVVEGKLKEPEAIIDMPIERNPKDPKTFRVGANGKPATTHYKTLQVARGMSLLELTPTTGRTHQLRVHLSTIGHPIIGDPIYGGKPAKRMFLHAHKLELTLPNKSRKIFTAPVPGEFAAIIK